LINEALHLNCRKLVVIVLFGSSAVEAIQVASASAIPEYIAGRGITPGAEPGQFKTLTEELKPKAGVPVVNPMS